MNRAPVIDVHTHMLTKEWLSLLEQHGNPRYSLKEVAGGLKAIHLDGSPFMTPVPNMFDWEARIANMNKARVDIAITSLTCPNAFWGSPEVSLKAARIMNDDMAKAQKQWPDRIRWFASLAGGALPCLGGRLDTCWENIPAGRAKTVEPPRNYLRRIYVDTVVFRQDVLEMCVSVCGTDNVLYGSDYPHTIGDMAGCLSRVDALPGDVREKVRGGNAQHIFRL